MTLAALREELHVRAENAGTIVGPLVLVDDGDRVDCARLGKGGYSVPSIVEPEYLEIRRCTADFVLLVEKGTQWNRLSEDKFWRRYNCVLLTGNGQPPRGVRRLARRLHEEIQAPRLRPRRQRPVGLLHLLGHQAGLDQPRVREPAHGHPEGQVHRPLQRRPRGATTCRATSASSSTTRTSPAPRSSSATPGSRRSPGRRRSSGCSRAGSSTSSTPSPTRTSSYLTKTYLPRKLKEKDWLD